MTTFLSPIARTLNLNATLCMQLTIVFAFVVTHAMAYPFQDKPIRPFVSKTTCPVMLTTHPPEARDRSYSLRSRGKIVGGQPTGKPLASYLALLGGRCTGTVIGRRTILTAAHCENAASIAFIGATFGVSGARIPVSKFIPSPMYDADKSDGGLYDWALAILSEDVPSNVSIMAVNVNRSIPSDNAYVRAVGYGILEEGQFESNYYYRLHQVDIPVLAENYCASQYKDADVRIDYAQQVCAGYPSGGCDSCQGDSGGPILQYDEDGSPILVGVVSAGAGCARAGFPGIYIRAAPYASTYPNVDGVKLVRHTNESFYDGQYGEERFTTYIIILMAISGVTILAFGCFLIWCCCGQKDKRQSSGSSLGDVSSRLTADASRPNANRYVNQEIGTSSVTPMGRSVSVPMPTT